MANILRIPPEVLISIFTVLETANDLVNLIRSCSALYRVYHSHKVTLVTERASGEIVCFQEAVRAVRATEQLKSQLLSNSTSIQPIEFIKLPLSFHRDSVVDEVRKVLGLEHLRKCMQTMILSWEVDTKDTLPFIYDPRISIPPDYKPDRTFTENLSRALYNSILIAVFLTSIYAQPIHKLLVDVEMRESDQSLDESVRENRERLALFVELGKDPFDGARIKHHDAEWLRREHVIFNTGEIDVASDSGRAREEVYRAIFEPFTSLLVEEMRNHGTIFQHRAYHPTRTGQDTLYKPLVELVDMLQNVKGFILNKDGGLGNGFGRAVNQDIPFVPSEFRQIPGQTQSIETFVFGTFRLESITMPTDPEIAKKCFLLASGVKSPLSARFNKLNDIDIPELLAQVHFDFMTYPSLRPRPRRRPVSSDYDYVKYLMRNHTDWTFWNVWDEIDFDDPGGLYHHDDTGQEQDQYIVRYAN